ncbi:MAG: hypothetical protein IJZ94_01705 [Clostridia bacterium]|nr:hypothetical protein [Clostridia bacterium]
MEAKKRLPLFWRTYLIVFGVIILIMIILLLLGYNLMMDYHNSQSYPSDSANNYAKSLTQGSYGLLCEDETNAACVFEKDVYTDIVNQKLNGSEIVCEKGFSSDRYTRPVYRIKANGESVADVSYLLKDETSKFGFALYDFEHIYSLIKGDYGISLIIPSDAILYLNNVAVGDNWIVENDFQEIYDVSANLYGDSSTSSSSAVSYKKYVIEGLFAEPQVRVTDAGGNILNTSYNSDLKAFCTMQDVVYVLAPDNFTVSINGIDITRQDRFISEKDIVFEELSGITEYMSAEVKLVKYIVTGVDKNTVNVVAKNYAGLQTPVYYDNDNGYYHVYNCMIQESDEDKLLEQYGLSEDRLMGYAKDYAEFVADDGDRWSTIMPYVMPGSDVYEAFDSFWSVLANHNSFWYEDEKITDISFYAEDAFSCRTSFVYWIKGFAGDANATKDYPTDVTFYYVKKDGVWYITDWELHTVAE